MQIATANAHVNSRGKLASPSVVSTLCVYIAAKIVYNLLSIRRVEI